MWMWYWKIFRYENCKCRKKVIDKLVLGGGDEMLNAILMNKTNTIWVTK